MKNSKVIIAALTSLALGTICASIVSGNTIENPSSPYYDMSQAATITVNVDEFEITEGRDGQPLIVLAGIPVETELDEQSQAELFYSKEEIVVRIAPHNRVSILTGDNNGF